MAWIYAWAGNTYSELRRLTEYLRVVHTFLCPESRVFASLGSKPSVMRPFTIGVQSNVQPLSSSETRFFKVVFASDRIHMEFQSLDDCMKVEKTTRLLKVSKRLFLHNGIPECYLQNEEKKIV